MMKFTNGDGTQTVEIAIPTTSKNIYVNCSGGADSAILLYMVIKYLEDENRTDANVTVLTCANKRKGNWNSSRATEVINFVTDRLNSPLIKGHYTYYRDVQDVKYFHEVEGSLIKEKKIDVIFSGITANPSPEDSMVIGHDGNMVDLRDECLVERDKGKKKCEEWSGEVLYLHPFGNVDKKMVAELYDRFDLTGTLLPLTRSCEAFADATNNFTEPCGKCWWCLERKWAFGKL